MKLNDNCMQGLETAYLGAGSCSGYDYSTALNSNFSYLDLDLMVKYCIATREEVSLVFQGYSSPSPGFPIFSTQAREEGEPEI